MSFNLADTVKSILSGGLITRAASFLGEPEMAVSKAGNAMVPVILGGLLDIKANAGGPEMISRMAAEQYQAGVLNSQPAFPDNEVAGLPGKGAPILSALFGDKINGLVVLLSRFSGIQSASAGSLLGMVAPVVLAFLGKHGSENNLDAGGVAALLESQQENISHAIPAGLNLASVFSDQHSVAASGHGGTTPAAHTANHKPAESSETSGSGLGYLLPLLLFALIAAAAWYFMGTGGNTTGHEPVTINTDTVAGEPLQRPVMVAAGVVDSSGNFLYETGKIITINLPNAAGALSVGENATENQLYKFLSDSNAALDTVNGNWFEFTNVRFKTGGSQVDSASYIQLKNMVALSKAFPRATFKVGGYTDNTGDTVKNTLLSQKRAEAVMQAMVKLGAVSAAVTGAKGYGPQYPIGDNATEEGRAMNRRVAINVKSK